MALACYIEPRPSELFKLHPEVYVRPCTALVQWFLIMDSAENAKTERLAAEHLHPKNAALVKPTMPVIVRAVNRMSMYGIEDPKWPNWVQP